MRVLKVLSMVFAGAFVFLTLPDVAEAKCPKGFQLESAAIFQPNVIKRVKSKALRGGKVCIALRKPNFHKRKFSCPNPMKIEKSGIIVKAHRKRLLTKKINKGKICALFAAPTGASTAKKGVKPKKAPPKPPRKNKKPVIVESFLVQHDSVQSWVTFAQDFHDEYDCENIQNAKAAHKCILRIKPALKRFVGTTLSVLCADLRPLVTSIKGLDSYGGGDYSALGKLPERLPTDKMCVARVGAKAWGNARIRSLRQSRMENAVAGRLAKRVKKQFADLLVKWCRGSIEMLGTGGSAVCAAEVKKVLSHATVRLYRANLPGSRIGVAVLVGTNSGQIWDDKGRPIHSTATFDSKGNLIDALATGTPVGKTQIHGIGDLDGDGFDDLLLDARGETFQDFGAVGVVYWRAGNPQFNMLAGWSGG